MQAQTPGIGISGFVLFATVFAASLIVFPLSIVALHSAAPGFTSVLPDFLVNLLFFWPQLLLFPNGVNAGPTFVGHGVLGYVAAIIWVSIALAFGWYTRSATLFMQGLLILPVIIVAAFLVHAGLALFDVHATLDGP